MYMDDIKLFAKKKKEVDTRMHIVMIFSDDSVTEFGIEICAMLLMESGKRQMTEGIELPN